MELSGKFLAVTGKQSDRLIGAPPRRSHFRQSPCNQNPLRLPGCIRMEFRRCLNPARIVASSFNLALKFIIRPIAPRPSANAPESDSGNEPSCGPIPTTNTTNIALSEPGSIATQTTGETIAAPILIMHSAIASDNDCGTSRNDASILQRWTRAICRPAPIGSSAQPFCRVLRAILGSSKSRRCD